MADTLYLEFCNHVYLGQWELARACATTLIKSDCYNQSQTIKQNFLSTLLNIATNPYIARASWAFAPCPSFISYWASQLLIDLEIGDTSLELKKQADFNILLETFIKTPKSVLKELSSLHYNQLSLSNKKASTDSEISDQCLLSLRNAFKENPTEVSILLNMLLDSKNLSYTSSIKAVVWDIHYKHILNNLKSLKLAVNKDMKSPKVEDLTLKVYLLLSILPEISYQGTILEDVETIFTEVLELCKSSCFCIVKVYQSLLNRPSPRLCKLLFDLEQQLNVSVSQSLPNFYSSNGAFNHQQALLKTMTTSVHFLQDLMDFCIKKILKGEWRESQIVLNNKLFAQLTPLALILSWEECRDDTSALNIIEALKLWNEPNCDPIFVQILKKLKSDIVFMEMCQNFYQNMYLKMFVNKSSNNARNILSQLQVHSPLKVIHNIFGLKNIAPDRVLLLLKFCPDFVSGVNNSGLSNKSIYSGYQAMTYILEAIQLSCEYKQILSKKKSLSFKSFTEHSCLNSDKICSNEGHSNQSLEDYMNEHNPKCAYAEFVTNKISLAKMAIRDIFPLTFQVEVLENIFSLLFLMSDALIESSELCTDSDQGHEGENFVCVSQCETTASTQDTSQSSESERRISGRFVISTVKLKDQQETAQEFALSRAMSRSTESNSSCGVQLYTFLCNELIVGDLLAFLKDLVLAAKAEAFKVIAQPDVSNDYKKSEDFSPNLISIRITELNDRVSKLLRYINEAIWRFEVVKSGIFQKHCSVSPLPKKKHLFCSQTSASSSEGTDRECKKRKKKRKHKRSYSNHKKDSFAESSIIQCMLSSPEALLRYSLWSQNLEQARDVIQLFHLEESNEAKEVILTQELERISNKIVGNEKIKKKPVVKRPSIIEGKSVFSNLQAIEDAAAVGLQSSEIGLIIHQELSTLKIPEIVDISNIAKHPELMLGSENIYSIFLADLGYISTSSLELSSILFDMACRSWSIVKESITDIDVKGLSKKKMSFVKGNFKTLGMMNAVLKEFLNFQEQEGNQGDLRQIFWPLNKSSGSFSLVLCNFVGCLDSKIFKTELMNWKQVSSLLHDFIVLMKDDEVQERSGQVQKDIVKENRLHMTYKKLSKVLKELKDWSSESVRPKPVKYDNYLSKLLLHLHQVTTAVLDCKKQSSNADSMIYTSDFSILKESPVELLKKIILQGGVTPDKIEKFAIRMKVDLVHVLAQACLPHVSLQNKTISSDALFQSSFISHNQGYPVLILNKTRENWPSPGHPDLVARKLLQDIITMIQDTAIANDSSGVFSFQELQSVAQHSEMNSWMEDCSELAFVDLDLLQSREEKLAFFVNVTNVAWLHAILLETMSWISEDKEHNISMDFSSTNFHNAAVCSSLQMLSPNLLERLTTQKVLGYTIGQLGSVSLFDMKYQLLRAQLPIPKHLDSPPFYHLLGDPKTEWEKYMPHLETRLLFVLIEGLLFSPKLKALHSEIVDDELDEAMKDYFDFSINIILDQDTIILPKLLEWYASDFAKENEKDLDKAPYEGLINLLSSLVGPNLKSSFQTLLSGDTLQNSNENIDASGRKQLPFNLLFKDPIYSVGIQLQYSTLHGYPPNETLPKSVLILETQPFVLNYLKEKCPILNDLYEIFRSNNALLDNTKENLCTESQANNLFLMQENDGNNPITKIFAFYLNMRINANDPQSWFSCALSPAPDREFVTQQIQTCFAKDAWLKALLFCDHYLESFEKDYSYLLLRQIILEHIACSDMPYDTTEPYQYALCINDPIFRAKTVLNNVNKWSDNSAIQALKHSLSDPALNNYPDVYSALKNKLKEVQLYKKIFDASEMFGDSEVRDCVYVFNNWQEVADCSIWDQSRILEFIKSCGKYELAVQWSEIHIINKEQKMLALSMNITWFLSQLPPQEQAVFEIIDSFEDPSDCVTLCDIVLSELISVEAKLCIVQYLVTNNLFPDKQFTYFNMLLGLKMLCALKSSTRELYVDLVTHPYLLLEQMLMNVELKDAEEALNAIYDDLKNQKDVAPVMNLSAVNQLVEDYASKALEVHFLDALLDISSSSTLVLSTEDALTSDEPFIMPLRVPSKEDWVPDAKIQRCQVCREERFNMFSRRHHCRRCGRVVCANCSQHALIVEGYGSIKVRVCDDCYNIMTGSLSLTTASFEKRYRKLSTMISSSPRSLENVPGSRRRTSSIQSGQQFFRWVLSTESEQNASVRNEFSYEQTPSISLCYSILKLHTDDKKCAQFLMNLCDRLLGKIKSRRAGKIPLEIDYSLIISMMKSLLMNAKVKCHQVQDSDGEALAELYFQHLDIIKLLVNANCRHLIPREALTNSDTVRKLRDKLLEEERMNLALEVSTKFNLDKIGVWSSWGLFCLKAGDWATARSKFQQCLKVVKDKNDQSKENPLLSKILKVLEESEYSGSDKASAIFKSLGSLRQIKQGLSQFETDVFPLNDSIKNECIFYLQMYGTHFATVAFYRRHGLIGEALEYIVEKKCVADIFTDALFMPALKNVQLSILKQCITSTDPSLHIWASYLFATCRSLERLKYLNVLYEIQLFMEDFARAAKSSINFYLSPAVSYKSLFERHRFLHNAKKHYEKFLSYVRQTDSISEMWKRRKSILLIDPKQAENYIKVITLQEEVSNFFQMCESQSHGLLYEVDAETGKNKLPCPPTLFGNTQIKSEVVTMVLINAVNVDDGFELAAKIVKEFNLNATSILCKSGRDLVKSRQKHQVPHFLASVKCLFAKTIKVDDVILECASTIHKLGGDVEDIIKMLTSDSNKINAYIMCGRLKSAYLLAIKLNSALDVRRIMVAAEQCNQESIQRFCKKWLETNSSKLKSKESGSFQ